MGSPPLKLVWVFVFFFIFTCLSSQALLAGYARMRDCCSFDLLDCHGFSLCVCFVSVCSFIKFVFVGFCK